MRFEIKICIHLFTEITHNIIYFLMRTISTDFNLINNSIQLLLTKPQLFE